MTTLLVSALALSVPQGPVIEYGQGPVYSGAGEYRHIGWSEDETYFAFDTEINGAGAIGLEQRHVVEYGDRQKAMLRWEEGEGTTALTWLDAQTADLFTTLGLTNPTAGHLIYQYPLDYFLPNRRLRPWSQLKWQYSFVLNGETYRVHLNRSWDDEWTEIAPFDDIVLRYRQGSAKVLLDLPGGETRRLGTIAGEDAAGYSIARIYLSPSRRRVAVVMARFTMAWFEGTNILAEHTAVTGTLD